MGVDKPSRRDDTNGPDVSDKGWFAPKILRETAIEKIVAEILGSHLDWRRVSALAPIADGPSEAKMLPTVSLAKFGPEASFDFVADVGESVHATQVVASRVCTDIDDAENAHGESFTKGQLLIFGGDQIYPKPSFRRYMDNTVRAFNDAEARDEAPRKRDPVGNRRSVLALPGNHDWYDSLTAFSRVFLKDPYSGPDDPLASGRPDYRVLSAFYKAQTRSYFSVEIGSGWWLFGLDLQFDSDLDGAQVQYFTKLVIDQRLSFGESRDVKLIVCLPEPFWVEHWEYPERASKFANVRRTLCSILGIPLDSQGNPRLEEFHKVVRIWITGDYHHYARFERRVDDSTETPVGTYVICGGGGAHLHPTHTYSKKLFRIEKALYPSREVSEELARSFVKNFVGKAWDSNFFCIPALLYFLTMWMYASHLNLGDLRMNVLDDFKTLIVTTLKHPTVLLWVASLVWAFSSFSDVPDRKGVSPLAKMLSRLRISPLGKMLGRCEWVRERLESMESYLKKPSLRWFRRAFWTTVHLISHLVVIVALHYFALLLCKGNHVPDVLITLVVFPSAALIGGAVLGTLIVGCYLRLMMTALGRARGAQAFSAVPIYDFRSWMRFRTCAQGSLHAVAFGIDSIGIPTTSDAGNGEHPRAKIKIVDGFDISDDRGGEAKCPCGIDYSRFQRPACATRAK